MHQALRRARLTPADVDIVNMHATGTGAGDVAEAKAVRAAFVESERTYVNFTKGHIGHTMGAAGALELAGNLPSFDDLVVHPTINVDDLDPLCAIDGLVLNQPKKVAKVDAILNNSFGMLGINSTLIVKRFAA
jgi:3-oxoacyl-[acyl-carrier-protein] synthase II